MNTQQKLGFRYILFRLAPVLAMAGAAACGGAPSGGTTGGRQRLRQFGRRKQLSTTAGV